MTDVSDDAIRRILEQTETVAVVGISTRSTKPSCIVPRYLQAQGYRLVPVNPRGGKLLGERMYRSLAEIDVPVDMVEVFRPSEEAPEIARQAVALGARSLWLQEGVVSEEAERIARDAGLAVVMNLCVKKEHERLGLGPRTAPTGGA
jgi:predicted CoA-binding protein